MSVRILLSALGTFLSASTVAHAQTVRQDFDVTNGTVYAAVLSGGMLYIGGSFRLVGPSTGGGVPIDSTSGAPVSGFPKVGGSVSAVAPDGSGGWYIGGSFTSVGGVSRSNIAHILANNTVSPWNPTADAAVSALAVSGTTVYAGGIFHNIGGQARTYLAALDAFSGLGTSWDPNVHPGGCCGVELGVLALAVSGTMVYTSGDFVMIGGQSRIYLAALDATTGLATPWNPGVGGLVSALAVNGSTVYAGGSFNLIGGQPRSNIAALDATTGLATAWNPNASSASSPYVSALAVSGTTIYAGGKFTSIGGQSRNNIAALDVTTGLATAWDPNANGTFGVNALAVSGNIVYAGGDFGNIGDQVRNRVAALDIATGFATTWNPNPSGTVSALALSGSTVYVGGAFNILGGQGRNRIAALDVATGAVTAWDPNADEDVNALAVSGSTVYVGGLFTNIGGQARSRIAALDATTGLATAWDPNASGAVNALALSAANVYAGGEFLNIGGQARSNIAALDATTGLASAWNPNASGGGFSFVSALALDGNTVYAAGTFTNIGGQARNRIAALDATTGLATAWNPNADAAVYALAVNGTAIYAGGDFTSIGGQARNRIAALDALGGLATSWNPSAAGYVTALAVTGATIYAGGSFDSIGGQARNNLAALDAATGLAVGWDPNSNSLVRALAVGGTTLYAGGGFTTILGLPLRGIAAIGDVSTPTLLSLVSAEAQPGRVRLTWFAGDARLMTATVYRRALESAWQAVGRISANGAGRMIYEDTQVRGGARYGYRLGVLQGGREVFLGETWVEIPRASEFTLAGLRPNPALDGLAVAFSLPDASPARLELLDLAGRRIVARDLAGLGPGNHVVNLGYDRSCTPGIYLLRLTQGSRRLTARAIVIR